MAYVIYSYYKLNRTTPNEVMYQYQMAKSLADEGHETYLVFESATPQPGTQILPDTNVVGICITDKEIHSKNAWITLEDRIKDKALEVNQEYIHIIPNRKWHTLYDSLTKAFYGKKLLDITYTDEHNNSKKKCSSIAYITSGVEADVIIPLAITSLYKNAFLMHRDPTTGHTGWKLNEPGQIIYPGDITQLTDKQVKVLDELSNMSEISDSIKCIPGGIYKSYTYVFPFMGESNLIDSLYLDIVASGAKALAIDPPEWIKTLSSQILDCNVRPNIERTKVWIRDSLHLEKHRMEDNKSMIVSRDPAIYSSDWEWLNLSIILNAAIGV